MGIVWQHWVIFLVVLALGYWLGRKYPSALSAIPVIGS